MAGGGLVPEAEGHARVDHGLPLHHVGEILRGDGGVREHVQIRQPPDGGAGLAAPVRRFLLQTAHVLAPLEMQGVFFPVPADGHIHVPGGVLRGAGAETVQSQRVFVVVAAVVVVLSAGVQLAEYQLPVVFLLLLVPVHRAAPALILHLDGAVGEAGDGDEAAVALPRLVDGVGEDLKYRVLAAVQPVGAENNAGAFPHPVRAFQRGNALVSVIVFCRHCLFPFLPVPNIGNIVPYAAKNFKGGPERAAPAVRPALFARNVLAQNFR